MKLRILFFCFLCLAAGAVRADDLTRALQQRLKDQGFFYGEVNGQAGSETTAALRRFQIRYGLRVTGEADAPTLRALGLGNGSTLSNSPPPPPPPSSSRNYEQRSVPRPSQEQRPPGDAYAMPDEQSPRLPAAPYAPPPPSEVPGAGLDRAGSGPIFAGSVYERAPRRLQENVLYAVQGALARRGYYRAGLDGQPGPATTEAVVLFQQDEGLPVTGRLDSATLNELRMLPGQRNGPPLALGEFEPAAPPDSRRVYRGVWIGR